MYNIDEQKVSFKRVARASISDDGNKQVALSLASNDTFSIAQFVVSTVDDETFSRPLPGVIRLKKHQLMNLTQLLMWVLLRLGPDNINEEDDEFIETLRQISIQQQAKLEDHMRMIGFPPTAFHDQAYRDFPQYEEDLSKKIR